MRGIFRLGSRQVANSSGVTSSRASGSSSSRQGTSHPEQTYISLPGTDTDYPDLGFEPTDSARKQVVTTSGFIYCPTANAQDASSEGSEGSGDSEDSGQEEDRRTSDNRRRRQVTIYGTDDEGPLIQRPLSQLSQASTLVDVEGEYDDHSSSNSGADSGSESRSRVSGASGGQRSTALP